MRQTGGPHTRARDLVCLSLAELLVVACGHNGPAPITTNQRAPTSDAASVTTPAPLQSVAPAPPDAPVSGALTKGAVDSGTFPPQNEQPLTAEQIAAATKVVQDYIVRNAPPQPAVDPLTSPERLARDMTGTIKCTEKRKCRAGLEVCVSSPNPALPVHCEPIRGWVGHHTPVPRDGFPPMAGITACQSSDNCPRGTFCCVHEIGAADVQALVCHASLSECRGGKEVCDPSLPGHCRTPGTTCSSNTCEPPTTPSPYERE